MDAAALKKISKEFFRAFTGRTGLVESDSGKNPVRVTEVTDTGTRDRSDLFGYAHKGWGGGPPRDEDAILVGFAWAKGGGPTQEDSGTALIFPDVFKGVKVYYDLRGDIKAVKGSETIAPDGNVA